jgi:tRNA dimethylallyltransferase
VTGPGQPLIVVVGPTASGKTALALRLARRLGGEVVGADAYQVYRGMDVGTAKPTPAELGGVRHHLLDVADPDEHFDAHRFLGLADEALAGVAARGAVAIVAGGTGLYARALVRGLADMPGADAALRAALEARAAAEGRDALHRELARVDPAYAARVGPSDLVRVVRALEVHALTGRTITDVHEEHERQPDRHRALWLGLDPGREGLRSRIEARTARMFETGFADEVRRLLAAGHGPDLPPMRALGYRAVCRLVAGEIDEAEARRLTCRDTARYAKRQRNWFRHEPTVRWLDRADAPVEDLVDRFLDGGGR